MTKPLKQAPRPQNMSQLDYLWTYFGSYEVSDSLDTPNSIPTSEAVKQFVTATEVGIVELGTEELSNNKIKIFGLDANGQELTSVQIDKDVKVVGFTRHKLTQEDVDNGIPGIVGEEWLKLTNSDGSEFFVSLESFNIKGHETDTTITEVIDSVVSSTVKINNPTLTRTVDIKTTPHGIYADLVINPDTKSKVLVVKGKNGIECQFNWQDTNTAVGLQALTFAAYQLITPDPGTIYFITDEKAIYFQGAKYSAVGLDPNQYATKDDLKFAVKEETDRAEAAEEALEEKIETIELGLSKMVKWIDIKTEENPNRKAIVLGNHDTLLGTTTDGNTYNLAMISKWNIADFGTTKLPLNFNGLNKRPTYNDKYEIPVLDNVPTTELPNRKALTLENGDMIIGKNTKGDSGNLIMVNRWDVVDIGTPSMPLNLNTPIDKRPTVQTSGQSGKQANEIAYLSDLSWTDV